jgi:nucleoside-diphosphate-sugar epimerase
MKIMVTGATGYVGNHVIEHLLGKGHDVIAVGRSAVKAAAFDWFPRVRWVDADIQGERPGLLHDCGNPRVLLHLAWDKLDRYRDPEHFESLPGQHYRFIRGLVREGLQHCLVAGTCLEYGMQRGALHEDLPANPILAYPLGKHILYEMLTRLQKHASFRLQWVRLFYLHGTGQRRSSLLAQVDSAIEDGRQIFDMSPGDQLRDYLHVQDAASIIGRIATRSSFDGIVNCCAGTPVTVRALVEEHVQQRGAQLTLNPGKYPYPDYEPFDFWGDRRRLDAVLAACD